MLDLVLDLLFPPVCGFCDKLSKEHLCKNCEEKIKRLEKHKIIEYKSKDKYFDKHIYIYKYAGIIRDTIIRYKFKYRAYIYRTLAKNMLKSEKICRILKNYDIIISVPIHRKRKLQRGYDQSFIIARELSKNIGVQLGKNVLIKVIDNKPQSSLNRHERLENIKNVYKINESNLKDKKILLFDDIYTTGNTVNECSRILKEAGAKTICVLTIARD